MQEKLKINIAEKSNGYEVNIKNSIRYNGEYVYRAIDILPMLEVLGEAVLDKKVEVRLR